MFTSIDTVLKICTTADFCTTMIFSERAVNEDAMQNLALEPRTIDSDGKFRKVQLHNAISFPLGKMQYDMPLDLHMPWSLCLP